MVDDEAAGAGAGGDVAGDLEGGDVDDGDRGGVLDGHQGVAGRLW